MKIIEDLGKKEKVGESLLYSIWILVMVISSYMDELCYGGGKEFEESQKGIEVE